MEMVFKIEEVLNLFDQVQREEIFDDQKKMADAIPIYEIDSIKRKYEQDREKKDFNLKTFVLENFEFLEEKIEIQANPKKLSIEVHIENLWEKLTKKCTENEGSLIALPNPYIVPGGRFSEFFYWDSYFVLLGLQEAKKYDLIEGIIENCAHLIREFGFVPNGNRSYFLSRSQPPYFALMVELLAETKGEKIYGKYQKELLQEYHFWMMNENSLSFDNRLNIRVVLMQDGTVLNRYFDGVNFPRFESYLIDVKENEKSTNLNFYSDIRSACESGWDFSARWFRNYDDITTIETQNIVPIDLNCLLWKLEKTIAKSFEIKNNTAERQKFENLAQKRKDAIQKYFWSEEEGFYFDYHFEDKKVKKFYHIASVYPLFLGISDENQAKKVAEKIESKFLKKGGIVTSDYQSGQQWDSPNGWAPNQWITFLAMKNYEENELANKIRYNWCTNVERVYENTGKLMEKYNVEDIDLLAGGGEYPNQDGFGWTNGVYLKLKKYL